MHKTTTRRRLIVTSLMIALAIFTSHAQSMPEYTKGLFSLDIGMGANIDISSLDATKKSVFDTRPSVVTQIGLRPAYYFSRHWGAYADLRFNLFRFNDTEKILDIFAPGISKIKPLFSIGGTYRFEHSHWQIQPRLGIGYNFYGGSESDIRINDRHHIHHKLRGDVMCLDAAISLAYRTSHTCAIYLDLNTTRQITPAKYTFTATDNDGATTSSVIKSHTWANSISISAGIRLQMAN